MLSSILSYSKQSSLLPGETSSAQVLPFFPLVRSITRKFARGEGQSVPYDDLYSEAMFGLVYAQRHFKPTLKVPFDKYVMMVICHRLRNLVRYWQKHYREVPMPRSRFNHDIHWQPSIEDDMMSQEIEAQKLWLHVQHNLTEREYSIIQMQFQQQLSPRQIANRMGVSKQRICQLIARAMQKLRHTWPHHPPVV